MQRLLVLVAALALCSTPALAQTRTSDPTISPAVSATAVPAAAPDGAAGEQRPSPSLHVSTDEVRRNVRAAEELRESDQAGRFTKGTTIWLALIIVGLVVGLILID